MIGFDEAFALVAACARPLGRETVSLAQAHRRLLAAPVIARVDSPPADVSAMDGYAVREADLPQVRLIGASYPGTGFAGEVGVGECVRIFTGAPVPRGVDRVIVQEIARADGDRVTVEGEVSRGRHIRLRASDFAAGDELLPAGRCLDSRALVAAAGADAATVEVWRRPRVTVLGTGDELVEPGTARATPGAIPESVSLGVAALVEDWGGEMVSRIRLRDDPDEIARAARAALEASDLVVITGGASVGEKDYARSVLAGLGLELLFSKVAIKPGKPVCFGRAGGTLVIGLPGNPTSALVTARLLLAPLVAGLAGADPMTAARWRMATLQGPLDPCGDRETFVRGRWEGEGVRPLTDQDSGAQRALAEAELLIRRRPEAPACVAGERVEIIDF